MRAKINLVIIGTITFIITVYSTYEPLTSYGGRITTIFHLLAYFSLATALNMYFHDKRGVGRNEAAVFAAIVGLLIEMHQFPLPYRAFSTLDVLFNSLGASIVLFDQKLRITERLIQIEDAWIRKHYPRNF